MRVIPESDHLLPPRAETTTAVGLPRSSMTAPRTSGDVLVGADGLHSVVRDITDWTRRRPATPVSPIPPGTMTAMIGDVNNSAVLLFRSHQGLSAACQCSVREGPAAE